MNFRFHVSGFSLIWKWLCCGDEVWQQRRRRNGWSWPPSFPQMLAWITVIVVAPGSAFLLIPLHIIYVPIAVFIATVWLVLQMVILTSIDPAINNLRKDVPPAHFDPNKHEHVIENLFCNVCLVNVDSTCKHCRQCNKCVSGFDHHCKWLNNCVGAANYRLFLLLLFSICCISATLSAFLIVLPVLSFINTNLLPYLDRLPVKLILWEALCLASCIPYIIIAILCANLLYFHYQLWERGMTTYNFIRANREYKLEKTSVYIKTVSDTIPTEGLCSKRNFIKSRAVHDSTFANPNPSSISQQGFGGDKVK